MRDTAHTTLPVIGGRLDGTDAAFDPRGYLVNDDEWPVERYTLALDETGARYWRLAEQLQLAPA